MPEFDCDILVIGGGIAGVSIAAHLAQWRDVTVLEMEDQPGYHSTGRSAAVFSEAYGNDVIRALSRASRGFFFHPPDSFCTERLVHRRSILVIGRTGQDEAFARFVAQEVPGGKLQVVDAAGAVALCPALRLEGLLGGVLDADAADIEVHALHQGYIRALKRHDGELVVSARVIAIRRRDARWIVETTLGTYRAAVLVNAAGAWAEQIGRMARAQEIGLQPRRRSAALIDPGTGIASADWPMVGDVEEQFYMKPDAGLLLLSPADETPDDPGDAQADDLDIAIAADRLQSATTIEVRRIKSKWAGLRSFVPDRSPVVGYDALQPDFFWHAALGGYGIQTAPALSRLAANMLLKSTADADVAGIDQRLLSPLRLREMATI